MADAANMQHVTAAAKNMLTMLFRAELQICRLNIATLLGSFL
jgi:hypothetical protein